MNVLIPEQLPVPAQSVSLNRNTKYLDLKSCTKAKAASMYIMNAYFGPQCISSREKGQEP